MYVKRLLLLGFVFTQFSWANHGVKIGLHPGYELTKVRPDWFEPKVSAMGLLPDGRMLVYDWMGAISLNRDPVGVLYSVSNVKGNNPNAYEVDTVAKGFISSMGLMVVDNDVYISEMDSLFKLVDNNKDGYYESREVLWSIESHKGHYEYTYGPAYHDGFFYLSLSPDYGNMGNGFPGGNHSHIQRDKDRSTVIKIPKSGGPHEVVADGLRSTDGITVSPNGEIFLTDNQGVYRPANAIYNVRPGRHYGYVHIGQTPPQNVYPPVVHLPYGILNDCPTDLEFFPTGIYKDQILFGDMSAGGLYRVFLDEVNGEYQGAAFRFSGGLEGGPHRLVLEENGNIFVGHLGTTNKAHRRTNWNETNMGLERLTPKDSVIFEPLSIKTRQGGMEIEFTLPVDPFKIKMSDFKISDSRYVPDIRYGCCNENKRNLSLSGIRFSNDNRRVFLEIPNLMEDRVLHFEFDSSLTSASGDPLWIYDAFYTMNHLSDESPLQIGKYFKKAGPSFSSKVRWENGKLFFMGTVPKEIVVYDIKGIQRVRIKIPNGVTSLDGTAMKLEPGLYHIKKVFPLGNFGKKVDFLRID